MNEYQKARAVVLDKNNSFAELSEWSGMSIPRLKQFRADPEKLKTAKWIAVHKLAGIYKEAIKMNYKEFQLNDVKLMELLLEHKNSINTKFRNQMIEDVDWLVSDVLDYNQAEQKIAKLGIYDVMGFLQGYHKDPDYERVMDWDLEDPESDWHDYQTCRAINLMKMPEMAEDPDKIWTALEKRLQAVKENCESGKFDYYKA